MVHDNKYQTLYINLNYWMKASHTLLLSESEQDALSGKHYCIRQHKQTKTKAGKYLELEHATQFA